MKARIKKTGEVVNIADYAKVTLDRCDSWGNPIELGFDEVEILQEPASDIDWERRRYKLVIETVRSLSQGLDSFPDNGVSYHIAQRIMFFVDTLISKLKEGAIAMKHCASDAQWRINAVWHDARKEVPEKCKPVLTERSKSGIFSVNVSAGMESYPLSWARWAYIDDLLPERKEE